MTSYYTDYSIIGMVWDRTYEEGRCSIGLFLSRWRDWVKANVPSLDIVHASVLRHTIASFAFWFLCCSGSNVFSIARLPKIVLGKIASSSFTCQYGNRRGFSPTVPVRKFHSIEAVLLDNSSQSENSIQSKQCFLTIAYSHGSPRIAANQSSP